jgi:prepilin-type N-terminal cleavage/methylation domain-containing protein
MKSPNQPKTHRGEGGYTTKQSAFTLIELLVVIAIIGILATVVIASLNNARNKGADASVKSNLNTARVQAELYYDSFGSYTSTGPSTYYGGDCITVGSVFRDTVNVSLSDPVTKAIESAYQAGGAAGKQCRLSPDRQSYAIFVRLKTSSGYWCVDSSGNAREVSALPAGEVARCV